MYLYPSIKTLSSLDLSHNKISDKGAQYLAERLRHNNVRLTFHSSLLNIFVLFNVDTGPVES